MTMNVPSATKAVRPIENRNPDKFNLLGVEVKDAHCSSTRQLRLRPVIQRDICDGEKAAWRRMVGGPALDFCPALGAMSRRLYSGLANSD
jgi:hypothetical protein